MLRSRRCGSASGFSIVEGLVAMLLLLVVMIGILPLFPHAMVQNLTGRQLSQASNLTQDRLDGLLQLPLDNELLTIPPGDLGLVWLQVIAGRQAKSGDGDEVPEFRVLGSFTTGLAESDDPEAEEVLAEALGEGAITQAILDDAAWVRVGVVRQYRITSLSDGIISEEDRRLEAAEQLPGGTPPGEVHLKKIDLVVLPQGKGEHYSQAELRASLVKAF